MEHLQPKLPEGIPTASRPSSAMTASRRPPGDKSRRYHISRLTVRRAYGPIPRCADLLRWRFFWNGNKSCGVLPARLTRPTADFYVFTDLTRACDRAPLRGRKILGVLRCQNAKALENARSHKGRRESETDRKRAQFVENGADRM